MLATQDCDGGGAFEPFVLAQRKTPMTSSKLLKILELLLGKEHTLKHAAIALRCDEQDLNSWLAGESQIPGPVISALELALDCPQHKRPAVWSLKWLIDG